MTAARKRTLIIFATFVVALILACGFSFAPPLVADALLPDSWNEAASGNTGDWYLDADNLDIDALKSVVEWWKSSSSYDMTAATEEPVVIAVIDSGVNYNHDIFGGANCPDVFLRDAAGNIVGADTTGGSSILDDAGNRHGTHVAGIIAVLIHALDLEDYIKIMPIKAGTPKNNDASFTFNDVQEAVDFALANGADVVNLSITADSYAWANAVSAADAEQAVFVAAAGNNGKSSASGDYYPAESDYVVGVMNYTENTLGAKVLASTSNYGAGFDIAAPGYGVLSADGSTTDGYKKLTGTSMASPVVSFAAALLQLKWRVSLETEVPESVSGAQCVREVLALHTTDTAYSEKDKKYYAALDLESLLTKRFVYSETKGEMVVSEDSVDVSINRPAEQIVLGISGTLELEAVLQSGENPADYDFVWSIEAEGMKSVAAVGPKISVAYDAFGKICDIVVTLELYSKSGALAGECSLTLVPVYQPAAADSDLTVGGTVVGEDGTVKQKVESGTELSIGNADYLSPDVEIIWYVDGEEAARGKTFSPVFDADGQHTVTVVVCENGIAVTEYTAVIYFVSEKNGGSLTQFFEDNKDIFVVVAVVLCVLIVAAVAVIIALAVRGRGRRAR